MSSPKSIAQLLAWWNGTDAAAAAAPAADGGDAAEVDPQLTTELGTPDCKHWASPRIMLVQMIFGVGMTTPGDEAAITALGGGLALDQSKTLVDFGARLGGVGFTLARDHRCRLIGLESDAGLILAANNLTERFGIQRLAAVKAMHNGLGQLKPQSVDAVVVKESIFTLPNRAQWFGEAARVLKSEGRLALTDIVTGPNPPGAAVRSWIAQEPQMPRPMRQTDLEKVIGDAGFEIDVSDNVTDSYVAGLTQAFTGYAERIEDGVYDSKWKSWALAEAAFWQARLNAIAEGAIRVHRVLARHTGALSIGDFMR